MPAAKRKSSRVIRRLVCVMLGLFAPLARASDCIPIQDAGKHVGETKCVAGTVLRVKMAQRVHFLDFCEDQLACPFTVVVFSHDLKDVGDVRRLQGRNIEINGAIKVYDGKPEIILKRISQINGGKAMIPALPKDYDVEKTGHYSAGRLSPSRKPAKTKAKPNTSVTFGSDAESDQSLQ
ncbi:MAG: hypothetical protein ACRD3B_16095 [Candidatus Sulfotelmatobacter sp.]